jgi:hypothetical protein
MTGNDQLLLIKYELKLPSEATPTSIAIQNQIQAVWVTTGSNVASNSGVFFIPFDLVTIGSYVASNSGGFFAYLLIQ